MELKNCLVILLGIFCVLQLSQTAVIYPTFDTPTFRFKQEFFRRIAGDELSATALQQRNWAYGRPPRTSVPPNCIQPTLFGPNPAFPATENSNDMIFSFDLFNYDGVTEKDGFSIYIDVNAAPAPGTTGDDSAMYLGIIDSNNNFFGMRKNPLNTATLGYAVAGTVGPTGALTIVDGDSRFGCNCLCPSTPPTDGSRQCSSCNDVEASFTAYVALPSLNQTNGINQIAAGCQSRLHNNRDTLFPGRRAVFGNIRVGLFAEKAGASFLIFGVQAFVKEERYREKSRLFSGIYTGDQLFRWYNQEINHVKIPDVGNMPYISQYARSVTLDSGEDTSSCDATLLNHLVLNGTTTTVNQWNNKQDTIADQQEFELSWYFPILQERSLPPPFSTDVLITIQTFSVPAYRQTTIPNVQNRLFVGVYEGELTLPGKEALKFNMVGFVRYLQGSTLPLGGIVWSLPRNEPGFINVTKIGQTGGGVTFSQTVLDRYGRTSLYLKRGAFNPVPGQADFYVEYPLNLTGFPPLRRRSFEFAQRIIQSGDVPPINKTYLYSWGEGFVHDPQRAALDSFNSELADRTQSIKNFLSGGTLSYIDGAITGRRLNPERIWGIAAFQFIGRQRLENSVSINTPTLETGERSSYPGIAITIDRVDIGCARNGSSIFFDKCELCGGDDTCADCFGVVNGTAVRDICGVCNGNNQSCACVIDACGVCNGTNSTCRDCNGVPNGGAVVDYCGVCGGGNRSCCIDYLGIQNSVWDWLLLRVSIDDITIKLLKLYDLLQCTKENLPAYDPAECGGDRHSGRNNLERLMVRDMVDQHTNWLLDCLRVFTSLIPNWSTQLSP